MDRRLRELRRQYSSGNVDAGLALISNYLRLGALDPRYLEIAAAYRHPLALLWLGYQPAEREVMVIDPDSLTALPPELYFRRGLEQIRHAYMILGAALPADLQYHRQTTPYPVYGNVWELLSDCFAVMENMLTDIDATCQTFEDWAGFSTVYDYMPTVEDDFLNNIQDYPLNYLPILNDVGIDLPWGIQCLANACVRYIMMWWDFCGGKNWLEPGAHEVSRNVSSVASYALRAIKSLDAAYIDAPLSGCSYIRYSSAEMDEFVIRAGQRLLSYLLGPVF